VFKEGPRIKEPQGSSDAGKAPAARPAAQRPKPPAPTQRSAAATQRYHYVRARQKAYFDSVAQCRGPDPALDEATACLHGLTDFLANLAGDREAYDMLQECADALASEHLAEP
jgi:hypothetical protein